MSAVRALWAPRTWRATLHALTGLLIVAITGLVFVLWGAAVNSLVDGNTGPQLLTPFYAVVSVLGVVPLVWWLSVLSAVQRGRFRTVLGVGIDPPEGPPGC